VLSEGGDNYEIIQASGICVKRITDPVPVTMLSGPVSIYNHLKSLCLVVISSQSMLSVNCTILIMQVQILMAFITILAHIAYRESGGIAPLIFSFGSRGR
jgi:hypothetical protein